MAARAIQDDPAGGKSQIRSRRPPADGLQPAPHLYLPAPDGGADIYQIAKNCRTSVEMIEKYYAAHIKTNLDASAINVMKAKPKKKQTPTEDPKPIRTSDPAN
jgi:hypothetical protein